MAYKIFDVAKFAWAATAAFALTAGQLHAEAHQVEIISEEYTPTIWIDPDGCQHWVMDDGFEGFMTRTETARVAQFVIALKSAALFQPTPCLKQTRNAPRNKS